MTTANQLGTYTFNDAATGLATLVNAGILGQDEAYWLLVESGHIPDVRSAILRESHKGAKA